MKTVEEYSSIINNAILGVHFQPPYSLSDPIVYTMRGNGKRLRPVLTLAVAEALGVSPHRVLGPAVAVEVYHNFTLLHDDVMDNSPMRRGQPSVWKNGIRRKLFCQAMPCYLSLWIAYCMYVFQMK